MDARYSSNVTVSPEFSKKRIHPTTILTTLELWHVYKTGFLSDAAISRRLKKEGFIEQIRIPTYKVTKGEAF